MQKLTDTFNRRIDYLRISVTDRCNLRCIYCMPQQGIVHKPNADVLSFEEIVRVVRVCVSLGIEKIRLTGGEPLVRKDLVGLVKLLQDINGITDIALTTNGILLKEYALDLKRAGLKRVNISLDTLRQARYGRISRQGKLKDVLAGIEEALTAGLLPLKINVLLLEDISKDEIKDFLWLTMENPINVRFLEFMPVNSFYKIENFISCVQVLEIAKGMQEVQEAAVFGNGPARTYKFKNGWGSFGLISPLSEKFCFNCNRLRLTADGFLKPCLHSGQRIDLRSSLRNGANQDALIKLIQLAVRTKPKEHALDRGILLDPEFSMCQIGG